MPSRMQAPLTRPVLAMLARALRVSAVRSLTAPPLPSPGGVRRFAAGSGRGVWPASGATGGSDMLMWNAHEAGIARFRSSTAESGPFTLAAYGLPGLVCWEVTWTGLPGGPLIEGEAKSIVAAREAAEHAADQLMTWCPTDGTRPLPQPRGEDHHSPITAAAAERRPGRALPRRPRRLTRRRR